jgi:hypothetical protein
LTIIDLKTARLDKIPPGPELDALVAAKVMGWKNVSRHGTGKGGGPEAYRGKKQDKAGRWRSTQVRRYSTDALESAAVEARMRELGILPKYLSELKKIAHANGIPADWASPDQRCRAALRSVRTPLRLVRPLPDSKRAAAVRKKIT